MMMSYLFERGVDMNVICKICGKTRIMSMPSHLRQAHKMKVEEYKEKFPDEKFNTQEFAYFRTSYDIISAKRQKVAGQVPFYR